MSLNVIMLGPPGAGKGTQAARLAREHRVLKISTGDILRDAVTQGSHLGKVAQQVISDGVDQGEDPATVAKAIVAAATDKKPKLRYPAGSQARLVSKLRRFVPEGAFDQQMRKLNRLAG